MIPNTDNREIISTKSQGFYQTPQDIMRSTMGVQSSSTDATLVIPVSTEGTHVILYMFEHE